MSGKVVDVRIVPHHSMWAVKISGGIGNKPVCITPSLEKAKTIAVATAVRYQVPLIEFDKNGTLITHTPWTHLPEHRKPWKK